jgi:hypothetical protein
MLYLLGATILATIATTGVDAHGYIRNPRPRAWTIPGHRFEWDAQSDGGPFQDCWDRDANDPDPRNNKVGPIEATYIEGSEISVDVAISAGHAGWHELRFCPDPYGNNTCFENNLAIALTMPSTVEGCPEPAPSDSTHAPGRDPGGGCIPSDKKYRSNLAIGTFRWKLPEGLVCEHCAMQWWWITQLHTFEHFKSCHGKRRGHDLNCISWLMMKKRRRRRRGA